MQFMGIMTLTYAALTSCSGRSVVRASSPMVGSAFFVGLVVFDVMNITIARM